MRSELVFAAEQTLPNRYSLCRVELDQTEVQVTTLLVASDPAELRA
jgi:hypothetical protein